MWLLRVGAALSVILAPVPTPAAALPTFDSPVTAAPSDQVEPKTSGDAVVWWDRRTYGNEDDLYGLNLATGHEFPVAAGYGYQWRHDLDGDVVVWADWQPDTDVSSVWGCRLDLSLEPTGPVVAERFAIDEGPKAGGPAISGDRVVWYTREPGRGEDIWCRDLRTGETFAICEGLPGDRHKLDVDGDLVVWLDCRRGFSSIDDGADLYAYDLAAGEEFLVCTRGDHGYPWRQPVVSGSVIAWADLRDFAANGPDVYAFDVETQQELPVATTPGREADVSISGSRIVWVDSGDFSSEPVLRSAEIPSVVAQARSKEAAEGEQFAPDAVDPANPWIDGERVAWDDNRNQDTTGRDIYVLVTFADVPALYWAFGCIEACAQAGIVAGYGDGAYAPEDSVTRAQMAVYIARALAGSDEAVPAGPPSPSFSDLPADHWAYRHVEYAVAQAVVAGYPEGDYRPDIEVDRGQMAVYIARARGWSDTAPIELFPDVPETHWAASEVTACTTNGVVSGYDDGLYHPDWTVTRDQMAVYIARAFELTL